MQYSAAPAWLLVGILLSTAFVLLASVMDWAVFLAFLFITLLCVFVRYLIYFGLLLFRRYFVVDRPANNKLQWKEVKQKRKLK